MQRLSGRLREVVIYENRGASSEKRSGHIYFMADNLLHAISKLHIEYFHVVTKVLRIF